MMEMKKRSGMSYVGYMFNMLNMLNMCNMCNMLNYIIKYFKLTANTRPMIFAYYTTVSRLSKQRKENGRYHLLIIVIHCLPETPVMLKIWSTGAPNEFFL